VVAGDCQHRNVTPADSTSKITKCGRSTNRGCRIGEAPPLVVVHPSDSTERPPAAALPAVALAGRGGRLRFRYQLAKRPLRHVKLNGVVGE